MRFASPEPWISARDAPARRNRIVDGGFINFEGKPIRRGWG